MNLHHMKTFVRVVDAGSFSAVARELGTTQPTVSRMIASLEDHLGARLLNRSTRAVTMTDDGQQFYDLAQRALDAVSEAANRVGRRRGSPAGLLRLGCPSILGRLHIAPRLPDFLEHYPDVEVELVLGDLFTDLAGSGLDLAVRLGEMGDTSLVARRIGSARLITVASRDYLDRRGTPLTPADLANHDCVVQVGLAGTKRWVFERRDETMAVDVRGRFYSNDAELVRSAVLDGMGITVGTEWLYTNAIELGRVRVLLPDYKLPTIPIHVVYSSRRHLPGSVRAMINFLVDEFHEFPQGKSIGLALGLAPPGGHGSEVSVGQNP